MKTKLPVRILAALLAGTFAVVAAGCASTATQASTGEYVDDSSITVKVKSAFVADPTVKVLDVSVETFKGVVQLSGFVATAAEKMQAERLAAAVPGVSGVKNNLILK